MRAQIKTEKEKFEGLKPYYSTHGHLEGPFSETPCEFSAIYEGLALFASIWRLVHTLLGTAIPLTLQ